MCEISPVRTQCRVAQVSITDYGLDDVSSVPRGGG